MLKKKFGGKVAPPFESAAKEKKEGPKHEKGESKAKERSEYLGGKKGKGK